MSCSEAERLFVGQAPEARRREHAAGCPTCAAALRDHEEIGSLTSGLRAPAWNPSLRESLLSVPSRTVSCEMADALTAQAVEGETRDRRLDFHLSRCGACAEAAQTLFGIRALAAPQPAPWFAGRVAASVPKRPRRSAARPRLGWRGLLDPKAAIGLAYAAAFALMILGFNPADVARRARTDLPVEAKSVVAGAKTTAADRIGALEEKAVRIGLILRSRVFGYGRAALSNAVQLVLKSETAPSRTRPRNGDGKEAPPKNETAIPTWRA